LRFSECSPVILKTGRMLNTEIYTKWGLGFTFSLPGAVRISPLPPSVTPLTTPWNFRFLTVFFRSSNALKLFELESFSKSRCREKLLQHEWFIRSTNTLKMFQLERFFKISYGLKFLNWRFFQKVRHETEGFSGRNCFTSIFFRFSLKMLKHKRIFRSRGRSSQEG